MYLVLEAVRWHEFEESEGNVNCISRRRAGMMKVSWTWGNGNCSCWSWCVGMIDENELDLEGTRIVSRAGAGAIG